MNERVPEAAADRLFEAVLHEQFRGEEMAAQATRLVAAEASQRAAAWQRAAAAEEHPSAVAPARAWMLAAALLAAAVVVGLMVWRPDRVAVRVVPAQDPPLRETTPRDLAHFLELLPSVKAIRLGRSETVGATHRVEANASIDVLDVVRWPEVVRIEGEALGEWRAQLVASAKRLEPANFVETLMTARFELADGSEIATTWSVGDDTMLQLWDGGDVVRPNGRLLQLVKDAVAEIERLHRRASGKAADAAELAALPADARRVECPWLADGKMGERLSRFPHLDTFVVAAGSAAFDSAAVAQLAALKTIRSLDLRAADLTGVDLAPLAGMPALTTLALRGLQKAPVLTQLAPRLVELTLEQCDLSGDVEWLRVSRSLRTLRLTDSFPQSSFHAVLAAPALTHLTVRAVERQDVAAALFAALPSGKLQSLRLVDLPVTGSQIASLAALPALRELAVLSPTVDDGLVLDLGELKQLTTIRLMNAKLTADGLGELRKALPRCAVDCVPGRRVFDTGIWILP